jgi:hypothetical protein
MMRVWLDATMFTYCVVVGAMLTKAKPQQRLQQQHTSKGFATSCLLTSECQRPNADDDRVD